MIYYVSNNNRLFDTVCSFDQFVEWSNKSYEYQVDTETEGMFDHSNKILLIQFGDYNEQYVLDFQSLTSPQKDKLLEILTNDKLKIFHNAGFDIKFLWRENLDIKNVYDTMLAEILLYAGRDENKLMGDLYHKLPDDQKIGKKEGSKYKGWYTLQRLAYSYCDVYLDKSVRGDILRHGITTPVIEYAGKDVKYLSMIKDEQHKKLIELGMANNNTQDEYTVLGLENRAVISFSHMEYSGVKLDTEKWSTEVLDVCKKDVDHAISNITKFVWENDKYTKFRSYYQDLFTPLTKTTNINWSSPQQKLDFLKTVDSSIESTNERELSRYKKKYAEINDLIVYNKSNKLYTAFAKKMPDYVNKVTKRVHTQFWQILSTGRVSSNKPKILGAYIVMYMYNRVNSGNPIN